MSGDRGQEGYSLVELLISLAVFSLAMASVGGFLVQNSAINKSEQMRAEVQANARNCVSLMAQRLRSAGWDPLGSGFAAVALDPDPSDAVSILEVFADLDGDGLLDGDGESILFRHQGDLVELRPSATAAPIPLAANVTNDADGDGVPEPMFVTDSAWPPKWIRVRVTAASASADPRTGRPVRFTVESEVALRTNL